MVGDAACGRGGRARGYGARGTVAWGVCHNYTPKDRASRNRERSESGFCDVLSVTAVIGNASIRDLLSSRAIVGFINPEHQSEIVLVYMS